MEVIFSNDDLAMEILSRFSALELSRFKCVSRRWKNLISDPSFLCVHHQRSQLRGITTLLIQQRDDITETGKWKTSMEVCHCKDDLNENKYIHIKGRFYWLTNKQRIITFDLEEELSGVIIAPGPMLRDGVQTSACLGDSDGYLHYACVDESDLRVWMLKDRLKLDWVLKHQLNLDQFRVVCIPEDDIFAPGYLALGILTFYDEVIYMMRWGSLLGHYNYVRATVLPYSATLAANGFLKVKQNSIDDLISVPATVLPCPATSAMSGGLKRSRGFVASNSSSYQGRRKRKRIKPVRSPHF
nr:hypothetical protein CFP56_45598 [Quercus suber]